MTGHSDDGATNSALLKALARGPHRDAPVPWGNPARDTVGYIHDHLDQADRDNTNSVSFEDLYNWRSKLDAALDHLAQADPTLWNYWLQPGTWLDSLLRLRSVLAHMLAKAYWDDRPEVFYAEMDLPRFLWGAR